MSSLQVYRVLVTGANSGLGFAICRRLIDEFYDTHSRSESLEVVITTRSQRKGEEAVRKLESHAATSGRTKHASTSEKSPFRPQITIQHETVDLTRLDTIRELGETVRQRYSHINVVICNAGVGGWIAIDWPKAFYDVLTDWVYTVTWPEFLLSTTGAITEPQRRAALEPEPALGEVFCANLFGHYMLVHYLMPVLSSPDDSRIIWVSSIEAQSQALTPDDIQGLRSSVPYKSSKRLTDILAITSELPSTTPIVESFYSSANSTHRPRMYVSHPGICATGIFPLPFLLYYAYVFALYVARWLGSIWHTMTPYHGATAPVWLALANQQMLDVLEENQGVGKWGSATDRTGNERVERTEVEGWGFGGIVGDTKSTQGRRKGRMRGVKDLTKEDRENFEELGRQCWSEMEALRRNWEARLDA